MNPRYTRLENDYKRMKLMCESSKTVRILRTSGCPPEEYALELNCRGIEKLDTNNRPVIKTKHTLNVILPEGYPRKGPIFHMATPIWHPNIGLSGSVCIGDSGDHGYAPSMRLEDLVVRIIQMIRYENIGLDRPLNGNARDWAKQNLHLFPLERS
jgi:ubiquitin-protein ligase